MEHDEADDDDENRVIPNLSSSEDDEHDNKSKDGDHMNKDAESPKSKPTTQDLFGEELDVSSDEGSDDETKVRTLFFEYLQIS